jgi:hypothetical protein
MASPSPAVVLVTKPGYRQDGFSRGLLCLLLALDTICREGGDGWPTSLLITAGSNGHTTGGHVLPRCEALDVRTRAVGDRPHTFRDGDAKRSFLEVWAHAMDDGPILRQWADGTQIVTARYFFQLEGEDTADEHAHAQVRRGHTIRA